MVCNLDGNQKRAAGVQALESGPGGRGPKQPEVVCLQDCAGVQSCPWLAPVSQADQAAGRGVPLPPGTWRAGVTHCLSSAFALLAGTGSIVP